MKKPHAKNKPSELKEPRIDPNRRHRKLNGREFFWFPEIRGKVLDNVELFTAREYHSISLRFQDKTMLHFVVDPGFTVQAELDRLKPDEVRCLKRWPPMRSRV